MRERAALAFVLAVSLLAAGCLGAQEEIAPTGDDGDGPETSNGSTRSNGTSPSPDGNRTGEQEGNGTASGGVEEGNGTRSNGTDERRYPPWPSLEEASVRPGVRVSSPAGQCTSNFLFRTPHNATLMLGLAAHCVARNPDAGDGCDPATEPMKPGTEVTVSGASEPGRLVYSSWWTMQRVNETSDAACRANDFALVALAPADRGQVHPAMLHYGGPTGLAAPGDVSPGEKVIWYGHSSLRGGIEQLRRNEGYIVREDARSAVMYSFTPGVPGDSGSGVQTADGRAYAVLSTVRIAPETGANGLALLQPALSYAQAHGVNVELVTWKLFEDGQLPG